MKESSSQLVSFYKGEGLDHKGRTIEDVWQLPHFWLEHTHDYIQWLFPIPEAGRFNSFAPLLQHEDQAIFGIEKHLQIKQRRSLDVMLAFFGLERQGLEITALPKLNMREHIWLKRGGHNHLRISRIIRSLHLCHQPDLAEAFQQAVIAIGTTQGVVSEQSVSYWRAANKN